MGQDNGRSVRVAYLLLRMNVGGAEQRVRNYLHWLPKPFEGIVCCLRDLGKIGEELKFEGYPIHDLGLLPDKQIHFGAVAALRKWFVENRIDLVHGCGYPQDVYGRLAAIPLGLPYLTHVSNVYVRPKLHRALANRFLAPWTHRVLCVSGSVADDVKRIDRVPRSKVMVLENGLEMEEYDPDGPVDGVAEEIGLEQGEQLIGSVGSLSRQKNFLALIDAVARLTERGRRIRCVICGTGKQESRLRAEVAACGLEDRFHFLGVRRPIAPILRELDLFVLPSLWEGCVNALVEAMACGLPVVASDIRSNREMLGSDHSGLVSISRPDALAEAIDRFIRDVPLRRQQIKSNLEWIVPRYRRERHMERLIGIYNEALGRARRPEKSSRATRRVSKRAWWPGALLGRSSSSRSGPSAASGTQG